MGAGIDDDDAADHRWALALVGLLLLGLVIGLAVFGLGGSDKAPTVAAGTGCRVHALKYTVTDSAEEFSRQKRFEADSNVLPAPGFYRRPLDLVPTLHAASHEFVVVFFHDGLQPTALNALVALDRRAVATKAPVIIAPREQADALVAIAGGYELVCEGDGPAPVAVVSRFAAQFYASVADPNDHATTPPPAPSTPTGAPSPAALP